MSLDRALPAPLAETLLEATAALGLKVVLARPSGKLASLTRDTESWWSELAIAQPTSELQALLDGALHDLLARDDVSISTVRERAELWGLGAELAEHGAAFEVATANLEGYAGTRLLLFDDRRRGYAAECRASRQLATFQQLLSVYPGPVALLSDSTLSAVNPALAELLGQDAQDLVGRALDELCHPDDAPIVAERVRDAAGLEPGSRVRLRLQNANGPPHSLELSRFPLGSEGGESLAFFHDTTTNLKDEQAQLLGDRLATLGLLAGGTAHALNNPLSYLLLNLEQARRCLERIGENPALSGEVLARLKDAEEGAERMAAIVRQLQLFSRAGETEVRHHALRPILESTLTLLQNEILHRGSLVTELSDSAAILATKPQLEQICLRLLVAAILDLPEVPGPRGSVHVTLNQQSARLTRLAIACHGRAPSAQSMTRLDADVVESCADPLQQRLGLCRNLVAQLNGTFHLEFLEDLTSWRIEISLPSAMLEPPSSERPPISEALPSSAPPQALRGARILVIDDDPAVGRALRGMLEEDQRVECVTDPRAALRLLLSTSEFDLVFCDIMMPTLSGQDIFQALRFNRPGYETRLVFMTGGAYTPRIQEFLEQIPNKRLEKPFDLRKVRRIVEAVVLSSNP